MKTIVSKYAVPKLQKGLIPAIVRDDKGFEGLLVVGLTPKRYEEIIQKSSDRTAQKQDKTQPQLEKTLQTEIHPAPIGELTPPDPAPYFDALIKAQREYYLQAYALNMANKPKPAPVKTKHEIAITEIKEGWSHLVKWQKELVTANDNLSRCFFWQIHKKNELKVELNNATKECQKALGILDNNGVNLDISSLYLAENMKRLRDNSIKRIKELQDKIDLEIKSVRPIEEIKGSPEALRAAESHFISLLREIPYADQKEAKNALQVDLRGYFKDSYGLAVAKAIGPIMRTIDKELSHDTREHKIIQRQRTFEHER